MHRVITNAPKGSDVDHINHNGLDNCKSNLRVCTRCQNNANQYKRKTKDSRYKGVLLKKDKYRTKPWAAMIRVNQKGITLGYFETEKEAAEAYNKAAVQYFGEYALLNEIE